MRTSFAGLVTEALDAGPLSAPALLATIRSEAPWRRRPTVGCLFWTLDRLVAGGWVHSEADGAGRSRYSLAAGNDRPAYPDPRGWAFPEAGVVAAEPRSLPARSGEAALGAVHLRGSVAAATRGLSVRARISLQATWRSPRR